jgi:hypothetical protein
MDDMKIREISLPWRQSNPDYPACKVVTIMTELSLLLWTSVSLLIQIIFCDFVKCHHINNT